MNIRRILVALDASPHSLAALDAAAGIASNLEAELLGLFVEDVNLLRVADLPFAREFGVPSAARRKLDRTGMERSLRLVAREARQAMELAAGRVSVRWTFRVARGPVVPELIAAADEVDLLALGKTGGILGERSRLGSTALGLLEGAPGMVLLLGRGAVLRPPVAVLVRDDSALSRRAVETATAISRTLGDGLLVLIATADAASGQVLDEVVTGWLGDRSEAARRFRVIGGTWADLVRLIRAEGVGAVVMPPAPAGAESEGFRLLVEAVECPVLLVR